MKIYKVWIDIEEYDTETESGDLLDCLNIACTGTFLTREKAHAFAEEMHAAFEPLAPEIEETIL